MNICKFNLLFLFVVCTISAFAFPLDISTIREKLALEEHPGLEILKHQKDLSWPMVSDAQGWVKASQISNEMQGLQEHWFHITLSNGQSFDRRIGFYNNGAFLTTLYIEYRDSTHKLESGEFMRYHKIQFKHDGQYNSFNIPAGDSVKVYGYVKYSSQFTNPIRYSLYDIGYYHRELTGKFIRDMGPSQYQSFLLGALLFASIFILLIGIWFKNNTFGYYILFLIGAIIFIALKGTQYSYLGIASQQLHSLRASLSETIQFFFFAGYGLFVIKLLDLQRYPKIFFWATWMVRAFFFYALGIGIYLLAKERLGPSTITYVTARIITFTYSIGLLIAIIKNINSPGKNFYIAGTVVFLIFTFLGFLRQDHPEGLLGAFSPVWYMQTGILLEATLFGLALGYQMHLIEKDKRKNYKAYIQQLEVNETLMKEMNVQLESTITERTKELEEEKEKQLRLEYEQRITQLEMQALRSQMNPHFIFNSLSSIRYQIQSGQYENASHYLLKFSKLLRQTLENSRKDIVTLEEELALTKLYLEIEGYRFGEQFDYRLDIDEAIDTEEIMLPPLLLQPFAENAIKHGLLESENEKKQIRIKVAEHNGGCSISLEDNGIGRIEAAKRKRSSELDHKSLGLEITCERMKVFTRKYGHRLDAFIEDKIENGQAAGTRVIIQFKPKYHV